jgi:hypothetical protein
MTDLLWHSAQTLLGGAPTIDDFAAGLCAAISRDRPELVASVARVSDGRLYPLGSSGLPIEYDAVVRGAEIGEGVGACGTAAARRTPVLTRRFMGDPLWSSMVDAGIPEELETCWAMPILCDCGGVLGTLALYWRDLVTPTPRDRELAEACIDVCRTAFSTL